MHPAPSSETLNDILRWPIVRGGGDFGIDGSAPIVAQAIEVSNTPDAVETWRENLEAILMDAGVIERFEIMPMFISESQTERICIRCQYSM
jgi:hypothetical protein